MAIRVLHGLAPPYFNQLVRVADLPGRHRLRSSTSYQLHVQYLPAVARFRLLQPSSGTLYHLMSSHRPRCLSFNND